MRALLVLLCLPPAVCTPPYFAAVVNSALPLKGGASLGPTDVMAVMLLEQQVKRIMGANPAQDLNVSQVRELDDPTLLRLLLLAVLGNFTTSAAASWGSPCALVLDPSDGRIEVRSPPSTELLALQVVVVLLMVVQFGGWILAHRSACEAKDGPQEAVKRR